MVFLSIYHNALDRFFEVFSRLRFNDFQDFEACISDHVNALFNCLRMVFESDSVFCIIVCLPFLFFLVRNNLQCHGSSISVFVLYA